MSVPSAHLVWFESRGTRYAIVRYAGRLMRMVWDKSRRVMALAFADAAVPMTLEVRHKRPVHVATFAVLEPMHKPTEKAIRGFLHRALNVMRDLGVL